MAMDVTFWGVRGTFPASGARFARYGGDTMCVEVMCGQARLILDAGTGLRALGASIRARSAPYDAHIVLSHLHLDHIMGLPHFLPGAPADARLVIHVAHAALNEGADDALFAILRPPLFPLELNAAGVCVNTFALGGSFSPAPGVTIRSVALTHQGVCAGIVVEWDGRKLCYVTDHEHGDPVADSILRDAVRGADLLIYDATFTDAEWPAHRGWGHSTWEEGLRLKEAVGVRLLAFAHHDPDRTDDNLDELAAAAAARADNTFFALSGLRVSL